MTQLPSVELLIAELNSFIKLMIAEHRQLLNWIETTLN